MADIAAEAGSIIRHRHLLWDLALKDLAVRYRSPALGFLWSILIPLTTVIIFYFVFSVLMKVEAGPYPFFLYLVTAVFPWACFSSAICTATESILNNRELIKNTFLPRQVIPISVVLASLLNFIPSLAVMLLCLPFFRMPVPPLIVLLPAAILLQTLFTVGLALLISCSQVFFRDTKYLVEIGMTIWFYLSPGFYSLQLVAAMPHKFFEVYMLNPFAGLFILYRAAFLKDYLKTLPPELRVGPSILWTAAVCMGVFFLGFLVFRKHETQFADMV